MGASLLQVHDISFRYGQNMLFSALSLSLKRGEMVGLLGPNGSGKTTLLRLLSGVLQPQQGQILLEGRNLLSRGRRDVARRIALVPQELHMPFDFTVEHMVSLGRTPFVKPFLGSRTPHDQHVIQEAIEITGIASLAGHIFNELSGGERQRVIIAMALAQQPTVLLLDEPTSHLDVKYQIETLELVQKLNVERGVTVVAAMHDLNLAARYFSRLLLFQRSVVADASPSEVLEPRLLSRVYGINVRVGILRGAEHLSVLPPDGQEKKDGSQEYGPSAPPLVHVIAGGGSGALLMRALADEQIPFSTGALNIGDSDHMLALRLATDVITEQPYAPISSATLELVRRSLSRVKLLVLCPTLFGPGNLSLLQEALQFAQSGRPLIVLTLPGTETTDTDFATMKTPDTPEITVCDYTDGEAIRLMKQILQEGAFVVGSVGEALEIIMKINSLDNLQAWNKI